MAGSKLASKFRQTFYDAVAELGQHIEQDILNAFDNEFGYDESGNKVSWPQLSTSYVMERGSAHPILVVDGDLRAAIKVVTKGASINSDVTSQKQKKRGGKGTISVAEISRDLGDDRPHTNPSAKWHPDGANVDKLFNRYLDKFEEEVIAEGLI